MTNIYSIIESFGRQFWVEPTQFQEFQNFKLYNPPKNDRLLKSIYSHNPLRANIIFFNKVMFVMDELSKYKTYLGFPILTGFRIEASLLPGIFKKSKLFVFKMRSKKKFRRKLGCRISSRRIRFDNISQSLGCYISEKSVKLEILGNN
uniref:Ribosomal protein L21 n=1 Tax=Pseudellipsoidion edaphicum TaxID=1431838 RepID=A0A3R5V2M0_9STRA|nr:ribosomal protein L21 [Pseudellipsoidion edaphicum]QAA12033.1 ribosomal protein L21 [Pseudellipsoidion edaphicum]